MLNNLINKNQKESSKYDMYFAPQVSLNEKNAMAKSLNQKIKVCQSSSVYPDFIRYVSFRDREVPLILSKDEFTSLFLTANIIPLLIVLILIASCFFWPLVFLAGFALYKNPKYKNKAKEKNEEVNDFYHQWYFPWQTDYLKELNEETSGNTTNYLMRVPFVGAKEQHVFNMFGEPAKTEKKTSKNNDRTIYKYFQTGSNRYNLIIQVNNGFVESFEDKR